MVNAYIKPCLLQAFGWIAFFALVGDGIFAFRTYWKSRSPALPPAGTTESTADLEQGRY